MDADGGVAASPRPRRARGEGRSGQRAFARLAFHLHLWLGIATTGVLVIVAVTGILLNHKRGLGLMPDVAHEAGGPFEEALPLARLGELAAAALPASVAGADVDRMDVRPRNGLIKVRFRDNDVTEVTLDLTTGRILDVGKRNDVFLELFHSGEIFGGRWVLLSDAAAVALVLLILSGYWLWLYPRSRH